MPTPQRSADVGVEPVVAAEPATCLDDLFIVIGEMVNATVFVLRGGPLWVDPGYSVRGDNQDECARQSG